MRAGFSNDWTPPIGETLAKTRARKKILRARKDVADEGDVDGSVSLQRCGDVHPVVFDAAEAAENDIEFAEIGRARDAGDFEPARQRFPAARVGMFRGEKDDADEIAE